jgi:hypothetical protein
MASFTDSISQFNPYVQQIPLEEMAKVGMYKQAQYDQGVQKVQSYIDNVAGLDIMHEADKKYLQSKLGQLGGKLKTVAAGDFSNQQLVSSVGGMASSLIKDQNIQNAVSSTALYKKQTEELEKAYKEGKSSIANVDDFRTKADAWLSNDTVGQKFTGRYSPYVDYKKQWIDVIKALHADETGKDFAYEKFIDPITGEVRLGELTVAMEREGVEGISEGKIRNAIRAIMSPDALNQMRIDANYQYKGVTPEKLAEYSTNQFNTRDKELDKEIARLEAIAGLDDAKPKQKQKALLAIKEKQEEKAALPGLLAEQLKYVAENPEEAKVNIFKQGALDQFAGAFSWEKRTTQILSNPQWQGEREADRLAIDQAGLGLRRSEFSWKKWLDRENLTLNKEEFAKKYPNLAPFTTILGEGTKDLPAATTVLNREIVAAGQQSESDINLLLNSVPELKASKLPLAQKRAMLQQRLIAFQQGDENQFGANLRDVATRILNSRRVVQENTEIINRAKSEIEKDPDVAARKIQLEKAINTRTGLSLPVDGKQEVYTAKEVYDIARKFKYITTETPGGIPGAPSQGKGYYGIVEVSSLTPKEKKFYNQYLNGAPQTRAVLLGKIKGFSDIVQANQEYSKDVDNRVEGYIANRVSKFAPQVEDVDTSTGIQRSRYEGALRDILSRYAPGGIVIGGETPGGDVLATPAQIETAKGWLAGENKNDIQYKTVTQGGQRYILATLGADQILLKMTDKESSQVPSSIDMYGQSVLDKQMMFNGSTNFKPNADVSGAFFQRNDFVKSKRFPIVADLKNNPVNPKENFINIQIKYGGSWHPFQLPKKVSATEARNLISGWTDEDTKTFLASQGITIK